jgi:predicted ArsR family transcriptional regulator
LLLETVAFVTNDDLAEQVASIAALTDPIRRDLYSYVTAQPAPVSRDQASDALGIARHTAKFHLDKLAKKVCLTSTSSGSPNVEAPAPAVPPSCTGGPADSCQ